MFDEESENNPQAAAAVFLSFQGSKFVL